MALILREEHGMCLENRMQRICANKTEKLTGGWRELLNEKNHNLYASLNIISVINEQPHTCSMHEREKKYTLQNLVRKFLEAIQFEHLVFPKHQ